MMPKLSAVIVIAMALVVQGATLVERAGCGHTDTTAPICETSLGSPNMDDCQKALQQVKGSKCNQSNHKGSYCKTLVTVGNCKLDVCGLGYSELQPDVDCSAYLQTLLNRCNSGGRVGGRIYPESCNVHYSRGVPPTVDVDKWGYHLQFSRHD